MNFLTDQDQIPEAIQDQVPSYLIAADNHNLGNTRGGSWFDVETWGDKFSNAGKLISTGILSGANSFYNTGVTVGNWFGAEAELNDTRDWISGIDSDLGAYYSENRQAADLVGFIAGSFLPGLGGVKILNAGQTALKTAASRGLLGENISRATGLLVPQTERYITLAAADINASTATFSAINQNGLKALMSGVGQNVLEGMAFETAVQATMFKSPILESQDSWDIAKNIAIGGVFQGVVGGAFSAAASLGKIKKLVSIGEKEIKPYSSRVLGEEGTPIAEKVILMAEDRQNSITRFEAYGTTESAAENFRAVSNAHLDKIRRIDNDIRTGLQKLTPKTDAELGNMIADASHGAPASLTMQNLLGAEEITRVHTLTKIEQAATEAVKEGKPVDPTASIGYVKLTGEGAGVVSDSAPLITNLADKHVGKDAVLAAVKEFNFKQGQNWAANTLKGVTSHTEAEARYLWADKIMKEVKEGTVVNQYDLPILERAYKDGVLKLQIVDSKGRMIKEGFASKQEMWQHIVDAKMNSAADLLAARVFMKGGDEALELQAISKITNTKLGRLEGSALSSDEDFLAWQTANKEYAQFLESKGLSRAANESGDTRFLPTYAKIGRKAADMTDVDGHVIDGMTYIKQQQKIIKAGIDNVVAKATGELFDKIPDISDSLLLNANRYGAGAGMASFANGGYGTLESVTQSLGALTKQLKVAQRATTENQIQGTLYNLLTKPEAAIEWSTINQKVTRSGEQWVRLTDPDSLSEHLITKKALEKFKDKIDGTVDFDSLNAELPEHLINLNTPETIAMVDAHIARSGQRTGIYKELRATQGMKDEKDPAVFRPIRANPKDYPFFAFVTDPSVTGTGHKTMIFANSEAKLQELINKVPSKFQVITKRDSEDFFKARSEYEYERTLHENYINPELKNSGVMSDFFTKTDPKKIVDDILQQHLREDDTLAVELMRAKNQKAFDWLEDQGDAYTKISASKLGSYSDRLELSGKNPYLDYIKTALDVSKMSEHPWLSGFNKLIDGAVSRAKGSIDDVFANAKSPAELEKINSLLDRYGMNTGYRDAATDLLVNHTAPKGELSKFIRGANAVLAKLTLGMDPLNALNNIIGANILRGTELKQITDAIKGGNSELAGQLAALSKIDLPGGVGQITSPSKLLSKALNNFIKDDGTLMEQYRQAGFVKDIGQQFKEILDDFTLKGTESVADLNTRLNRAFAKAKVISEKGEKISGNKFAEELNRFISADVMRQITDLGVQHNLLNRAEQQAYINTFVNRVEGNTIASQRPLMFQGPIGQAVGLFQSYQFNLMQQMFRYVAEGTAKDTAMLLGLQGTFYGIQGLPGFQFMNQHIVGTMSGNQKHVDLYDATYGTMGKMMGDLALYGLPSNILQANLYSRGDINPRHLTIIPTSIPDIPVVGSFGKFLRSIKDTVSKISGGGDVWESMLQGLEHNGLSRPLAGLAQTLQAIGAGGQVYSTTTKGSILFSNDLMSWATATRLAGGRPLDEAIINDGVFRIQAYQQYDRNKLNGIGAAIKSATIMGNVPDEDQVIKFAKSYAEAGGKQAQFNKFMMSQFKAANTSQSQKIVSQLQNPFAQKIQVLMGGGSDSSPTD